VATAISSVADICKAAKRASRELAGVVEAFCA